MDQVNRKLELDEATLEFMLNFILKSIQEDRKLALEVKIDGDEATLAFSCGMARLPRDDGRISLGAYPALQQLATGQKSLLLRGEADADAVLAACCSVAAFRLAFSGFLLIAWRTSKPLSRWDLAAAGCAPVRVPE